MESFVICIEVLSLVFKTSKYLESSLNYNDEIKFLVCYFGNLKAMFNIVKFHIKVLI